MLITTKPVNGSVVVMPHGDVDLITARGLRTEVYDLLDGGAAAVVLDLTDVPFMDSTGLGALVSFHRRLGSRLALANAVPAVRRILEITKFDTVLAVTDSVDDALIRVKS